MTRQEIFNTVATALLAQGKASYARYGGCLYRGPDGTKCAVGHLIPDEKYRPSLEGKGAEHADVVRAASIPDGERGFVRKLQFLHDNDLEGYGIDRWKLGMHDCAREYGLDPSVLD